MTAPRANDLPFWRRKSLAEMTAEEWESLCDGCGLCCLHSKWNADTRQLTRLKIACRLLDLRDCRCSDYQHRKARVPGCIKVTPENARTMPPTCAYRLVAEGSELYWWHHLVSGDRATVHQAGVSAKAKGAHSELLHEVTGTCPT